MRKTIFRGHSSLPRGYSCNLGKPGLAVSQFMQKGIQMMTQIETNFSGNGKTAKQMSYNKTYLYFVNGRDSRGTESNDVYCVYRMRLTFYSGNWQLAIVVVVSRIGLRVPHSYFINKDI